MNAWKVMVFSIMVFATMLGAFAVSEDFEDLDQQCYGNSDSLTGIAVQVDFGQLQVMVSNRTELTIVETCESGGNEIDFTEEVDLVLGPIQPDEVIITEESIYVDTDLRPDLDKEAQLTFKNLRFAVDPGVLKDGVVCGPPDCIVDEYFQQTLTLNVSGFSNYSLQARQDFTVHSDEEPEIDGKIYQVLDLGSSYRATQFSCVVMVFANNADGELVLVQTNPERAVQGKLFGDTDQQQPESLGYFPTTNGVANVYYRNDKVAGYTAFEYVAKCQSNSTQLIYEETHVPVYTPLGRSFAGRMVWLTTDNGGKNAFFIVLYVVLAFLAFWLLLMIYRRSLGGK